LKHPTRPSRYTTPLEAMAALCAAAPQLAARAAVSGKFSAKSQKKARVAFRVRAADEAAPAAATEEKKPEPIGPPRGSQVRFSDDVGQIAVAHTAKPVATK